MPRSAGSVDLSVWGGFKDKMVSPLSRPFFRFALSIGWIPLLLISGCVTKTEGPGSESEVPTVLRIGISDDRPPMSFRENRNLVGLEIDMGRAFAASLQREPVFVQLPSSDLTNALSRGQVDIVMAGMKIPPQPLADFEFTYPYLRVGQIAMVRRDREEAVVDGFSVSEDGISFRGSVGVMAGSVGARFVERSLNGASVVRFDRLETGIEALNGGRIDMFVHEAPILWWLAAKQPRGRLKTLEFFFTEEYLAWVVKRENLWLFAEANRFIDTQTASGMIPELVDKWMPLGN